MLVPIVVVGGSGSGLGRVVSIGGVGGSGVVSIASVEGGLESVSEPQ